MYEGILIKKDTVLDYENEHVKQRVENLVLHSVTTIEGDGFVSVQDTTIDLKEGDVLIFEEEGRGYIKPVEEFMTVNEVIKELECIKDI